MLREKHEYQTNEFLQAVQGKAVEGFMLKVMQELSLRPREDAGDGIVFVEGRLCQENLEKALDI